MKNSKLADRRFNLFAAIVVSSSVLAAIWVYWLLSKFQGILKELDSLASFIIQFIFHTYHWAWLTSIISSAIWLLAHRYLIPRKWAWVSLSVIEIYIITYVILTLFALYSFMFKVFESVG